MIEKEFSELLAYYIHESGYTNYEFARVVGINRVNIQRYLSGARVPNRQTFEKIADELHLGHLEQEALFESYQCAFDGKDAYYMKKTIREILENAANICGTEKIPLLLEELPQENEIGLIQGRAALEKYIWSLFCHAAQQEEEQKVYCFLPADRQIICRTFPTLLKDGEPILKNIRIVHLVQLGKRADIFRYQYHNLKVIRNLIPAYFQAGNSYETLYYYHDNPQLEMNDGLLYPYYLIFRDRVVLMDVELENALSVKNTEMVKQYLMKIDEKILGGGMRKLIHYYDQEIDILKMELQQDAESETRIFLEYEPCLAYWVDEELLDAIIKKSVASREDIIEGMKIRIRQMHNAERIIIYYTEEGLREFAETGCLSNYPEELIRPLTVEERMRMFDLMIASMEHWDGEIGIINRHYLKMTKRLTVFYSDSCGIILILQDQQKKFRYIQIKESSICKAFVDYIKSMSDHEEIYSREETKELLIKYRESLRKER